MGTDATVGRRTIIKVTQDCIAAVNNCNSRVTTVEVAHNQFVEAIGTRVDATEKAQDQSQESIRRLARRIDHVCESLPPAGVFARLRWVLFGPARPTTWTGIRGTVEEGSTTKAFAGVERKRG